MSCTTIGADATYIVLCNTKINVISYRRDNLIYRQRHRVLHDHIACVATITFHAQVPGLVCKPLPTLRVWQSTLTSE